MGHAPFERKINRDRISSHQGFLFSLRLFLILQVKTVIHTSPGSVQHAKVNTHRALRERGTEPMEHSPKKHIWVHLVLILISLGWGFNNLSMKAGFAYVTPAQFGGIRMLLAFPFMFYLAFFAPGRVTFSRKDVLSIIFLGLIGLGVFQTLFPRGIGETSAPLGGILMATMPIHVVILSLAFRLEKPQWQSITGVVLTLIGLSLIMLTGPSAADDSETTIRGILFVVLAELGYAINTTFLRPFMKRYPPLQVTGLAMSVSVIFYMLVYRRDMVDLIGTRIPWQVWLLTTYSGFIAFLLANILWNNAVRLIGSTQVSVYGNLPPVFVMLLSAILFGEVLTGWQMTGSLIILAGVVLVQMRKRSESPAVILPVQPEQS